MDDSTLLYQQVHPSWIKDDWPTSSAFKPSSKDARGLSFYDADQITPDAAYSHFTVDLGKRSAGIAAVTVRECRELGVPVYPAPENHFSSHVIADFNGVTRKEMEKLLAP